MSFFDLFARCDGRHSSARGRIFTIFAGKLAPHVSWVVLKFQSDWTRNGAVGTLRVFLCVMQIRCMDAKSIFWLAFELVDFERFPFRRFSTDLYEICRAASGQCVLNAIEISE